MAKRFGRRRKPRVAWLPTFGGNVVAEGTSAPWAGIESELVFDGFVAEDDVVFDAVPLTFDETLGSVETQASPTDRTLRDIIQGNEWRLRRIVGKAFIHASSGSQGATMSVGYDVALGFMVCKTYDDGAPWTDFSEVNPLSQESMEDPWIWRRRWLLHPYGVQGLRSVVNQSTSNTVNNPEWYGLPSFNGQYGSVHDGPHIDAKTARVIHRSERLFAVLAARRYSEGLAIGNAQDGAVRMLLDYRLLGSLRGQSYGNRGNTSR